MRTIYLVKFGTIWYNPKLDMIGLWDEKIDGMWTIKSGWRRLGGCAVHTGPTQWYDIKTNKKLKDPKNLGGENWIKLGTL